MLDLKALFTFRSLRRSRAEWIVSAIAGISLLLVWQLMAQWEVLPRQFLPLPWSVVSALYSMLSEQSFLTDIGVSVIRVWVAFLLSVIVAVPLGVWMSTYRVVAAATEPIIDFIRYLPVPALVPRQWSRRLFPPARRCRPCPKCGLRCAWDRNPQAHPSFRRYPAI